MMRFTEREIELARRLRDLGLAWEPQAGNFVLDENDCLQRSSPFQPGVFFVLNYEHFLKLLGGLDSFRQQMLWLPTWSDLRRILADLGVTHHQVAVYLQQREAIENACEREALYEFVEQQLLQQQHITAESHHEPSTR